MLLKVDYLIVGAGPCGATCARLLSDAGYKCVVIDRRQHLAGNTHDKLVEGIMAHQYGPHVFHTCDDEVWKFVNRFTQFNDFIYRVKVIYQGELYSFPINLMTMHKLFGCVTPSEARDTLELHKAKLDDGKPPANLDEWGRTQMGHELFGMFIYGYTKKQWGREPVDLPASILKRIPIRFDFNDDYFTDSHQGIPINGYTNMIEKMLKGIEVHLNTEFFGNFPGIKESDPGLDVYRTIYTGPIDEYFDYCHGPLEYRGLKFETQMVDTPAFQGCAVINYTNEHVPMTRVIEHKYFTGVQTPHTVITHEYPEPWRRLETPYYPVNNGRNHALYGKYRERAAERCPNTIFLGRLGTYQYLNMDQTIRMAMDLVEREIKEGKAA